MSDVRSDDLKVSAFDTWALIEQRRGQRASVTVEVDDRAAVRQRIIVELRRSKVDFMTRSDWKAKDAKTTAIEQDWNYWGVALHHAGNSYTCNADGAASMRRVQEAHFSKDYADVGYHYAIDCGGTVYEGRDIRFQGAHVGKTPGVIGIVLLADLSVRGDQRRAEQAFPWWKKSAFGLGTLDDVATSHDEPTEPQVAGLEMLTTVLKDNFPSIERFGGHREWARLKNDARACPGAYGLILAQMMRTKFKLKVPE